MAHCISKVVFLCVNMFLNAGDKVLFAQNVNLLDNENQISESDASPENIIVIN